MTHQRTHSTVPPTGSTRQDGKRNISISIKYQNNQSYCLELKADWIVTTVIVINSKFTSTICLALYLRTYGVFFDYYTYVLLHNNTCTYIW